jgi:biopolymer transport protein ExbD
MKFPRNAKIFRGHLDVTPFAGVFFCLLIFVLLGSLVYTPGVQINLPESASALPGVEGAVLAVAMDANGQFYFENQIIQGTNLQRRLKEEVLRRNEPVTLVVEADRLVTTEQWGLLYDLAARAGIKQIHQAVLSRPFDSHESPRTP